MKANSILCAVALFLLGAAAWGQTPAAQTDSDFRSRSSVGIDWKLAKGLHLNADYELRSKDNFSRLERNQLSIGVQYSPVKPLEIGTGYSYISSVNSQKEFKPKHRVYFSASGSYKFGAWKISLKEHLQLTHKAYELNAFQQTPNLLELKSRLKLSYKGFIHFEPYAYGELRNCLNGPSFTYDYNESSKKYSNYQFIDYSDSYLNRFRAALGVEWKINNSNSIDFKLMNDWCKDKAIDTNAEGTKLKGYSWEKAINTSLCIGYVFSF